jgi:hypothetical protein
MKMTRVWPAAMLVVGMAAVGALAQEAPKKAEPKPIGVLGWLVGGAWTADASKMGNGMQRIETRYQWADNGAYLRFTTHFVFDEGTAKQYDGSLFWDPEKKKLAMWYMSADGSVMQGPMTWEGDVLSARFAAPDFEGRIADLKVEVTRKTNDKYVWALFEKDDNGWKPLALLEYNRLGA